jgi:hypothetical protein
MQELAKDSSPGSDNYKLSMLAMTFPILAVLTVWYLNSKVQRFMVGFCPRKRMSCIGVYMRNVISLKQTMALVLGLCLSSLIDIFLQALFTEYREALSSQTMFWIWNIKGILSNEALLLVLPLALKMPPRTGNVKNMPFYVREPELVPKRSPQDNTNKHISSKIVQDNTNKHISSEIIHVQEFSRDNMILSVPNDTTKQTVYCKCHGIRNR